jgi:hypothetical protein
MVMRAMVRFSLLVLLSVAVGGCGSADLASAVARINSGPGIRVSTPYGGGTLGTEGQRERAERGLISGARSGLWAASAPSA